MIQSVSQPQTRASLLIRLRDVRDADAWELFVETYGPLINRYCRRHGLQEADAVDVSQDVLIKFVQAVRTFEYQPGRGRFRDWLGALVRSRLAEFYARKGRAVDIGNALGADFDANLPGMVPAEWPVQFHDHLLRLAMERARTDFEPQNWRAFEMAWIENRPASEVARLLSITVSTVYVAKFRVLERLRKEVLVLAEDMPHLFAGG